MELRKSTIIECVSTTADKDSQGEILDLAGADITPIKENKAFLNSDHSGRFEHLLGRVLDATPIQKAEDAQTPFQRKAWDKLKRPFLASKVELWDGVGHKEADAVAAIYRHAQETGQEPPVKVSVEGKVLERDPRNRNILKRTLIKGLALTVQPANHNTMTQVVGMAKSMGAERLVKSESPQFIEVADEPLEKVYQLAVVARQLLRLAAEPSTTGSSQRAA